jgi:Glycosyltransferase family 87
VAGVILRSRLIAPLLAAVAALLLVQYARIWTETPGVLARTSDFAGTYAAATLWREGDAAQMYDSAAEQRVSAHAEAPANHLDIPFENPPAAAVVASPFSLLDAATAYRLWSLLQLLLVGAAIVVASRVAPWPARTPRVVRLSVGMIALAGFGSAALWVEGQWDGLSVFGLALGYWAWRRDRSMLAGFAIGVTAAIAKPHLALGVVAFMVGRRDWRAFAGAAAGALATTGVALVAAGTAPLAAFAGALTIPRNNPLVEMQSVSGLLGSWLGSSRTVAVLALLGSALAYAAAGFVGARSRRRPDLFEPALAGAAALSLLGAPHLLSHDLALLAPALVFTCAWMARGEARSSSPWPGWSTIAALVLWAALSLASQRDLGNASPAPPGRVTPLALIVISAACVALTMRGHSLRGRVRSAVLQKADTAA